jgi:hypothetical protein
MKNTIIYALWLIAVVLVLTACSPKFQDLTTVEDSEGSAITVEVKDPDTATIYRNVDSFPNYSIMCINGDALVSRSVNYEDWAPLHLPAGTHNFCG